jgi:hypothetical protein
MAERWSLFVAILALIFSFLWFGQPNTNDGEFPAMLGIDSSHM